MKIFFSSDWHIRHKNMLLKPERFLRTISYEMDIFFSHWSEFNKAKQENQEFYFFFLGDLLFQRHLTMPWFKEIFRGNFGRFQKNNKFCFVRGNHDEKEKIPNSYLKDELGFNLVFDNFVVIEMDQKKYLLSHFPCVDSVEKGNDDLKERLRLVYNKHNCVSNLHGHIHTREIGNRMWNGYPFQCINIGADKMAECKPFVRVVNSFGISEWG